MRIFCGEHACIPTGVVITMRVQVCTLDRCCDHQRTHLRTRSLQDVHMRSCMCSLFIQRWGKRMGGSNYCMRALVAWCGGLFLTEEDMGVLSVSSLFLTRMGVYVGVGVCIRTHTHTRCTYGVLGCESRGQDETPGGPEESRWTKSWHTCIHTCAQSTHLYVYARRQDEILDYFFWVFCRATYLAHQVHQERTQVVRGDKED